MMTPAHKLIIVFIFIILGLFFYRYYTHGQYDDYCYDTWGHLTHFDKIYYTEDTHKKIIVCNLISGSIDGRYIELNNTNDSRLIRGI